MIDEFKIEHLNFKYSENKDYVLKDLSCHIERGKFTCIVGPNGCGKSTFVKILAGILEFPDGTIEKHSDRYSFVFQNPDNQFVSNVVEEDVAFGPENLCMPPEQIRKVVDDSLKNVDMYEERGRAVSSLSSGEKQRVAIAGAMALSTDCIIFDEPASMLNLEDAKSIISYIEKLHDETGNTIVCVSQNPELVLRADCILIMKDGKISDSVTPEEFVMNFENYWYSGFVLPEGVKLIKMLKGRGAKIKVSETRPDVILREIKKLC